MSKRAILRLDGKLEEGFRVTLEVGEEGNLHFAEQDGYLGANPELIECLEQWRTNYRGLSQVNRIKVNNIVVQKASPKDVEICRESGQTLQHLFKTWLGSESFRVIDTQLREAVDRKDWVRVVIRTQDRRLHLLPWHIWEFIDRYQAEVAFNLPSRQVEYHSSRKLGDRVRILAILGHQAGIDVETDRALLQALPRADVKFLVEPDRQTLTQQLWEQDWDVLFFAGHSQTKDDSGVIHINPGDSLGIEDLKFGLRRAIAHGLQLAIFNSCDGLGLVYQVEQLGLPQIVVMRQPVPDPVAQAFLKNLLTAFVGGKRFYLAVREAREQLQGFEHRYPCASWLPIIFQNLNQPPLLWEDLYQSRKLDKQKLTLTPRKRLKLPAMLLISLAIAGLVWGARSIGWFEPVELWAYDRIIQLQPKPSLDPRILVVSVTDQDVERFGKPLSDQTIVQVLKVLERFQPKVIGLDIYRDIPLEPEHKELVEYFKQSERAIGICKIGIPGIAPSIAQPTGLSRTQLGFADTLMEDRDGSVRRYSLLKQIKEEKCPTESSFALQVARQYLSVDPIAVNTLMPQLFSKTSIPPLKPQFGGYQQILGTPQSSDPIDDNRWQVLIDYRASHPITQEISLGKLLEQPTTQFLRDRIVLIGYANSATKDRHPTPVGEMFGVRIHAYVINQLLNRATGRNAFMSVWTSVWEFVWIVSWAVLGVMTVRLSQTNRSFLILQSLAFSMLLVSCWSGFTQYIWIPLIPAGIALIGTGVIGQYLPRIFSKSHASN